MLPIDSTRRTGRLDCMFGPTRTFGELDGVVVPTRPFGELDGVVVRWTGELDGLHDPTRTFSELNDGCFVVRDPLAEALSNLSRRFIVWILFWIVTNLISSLHTFLFF